MKGRLTATWVLAAVTAVAFILILLSGQAEQAYLQLGFIPLRLHARGGMGRIWAARDVLGREVAFKDMPPSRASDASAVGRFVREAGLTGRLEHPGVVPGLATRAQLEARLESVTV